MANGYDGQSPSEIQRKRLAEALMMNRAAGPMGPMGQDNGAGRPMNIPQIPGPMDNSPMDPMSAQSSQGVGQLIGQGIGGLENGGGIGNSMPMAQLPMPMTPQNAAPPVPMGQPPMQPPPPPGPGPQGPGGGMAGMGGNTEALIEAMRRLQGVPNGGQL